MAFTKDKVEKYKAIAEQMEIPEEVEAMGHVQGPDGEEMITLSFSEYRDIAKDFYVKLANPTDRMLAIAGAMSELATGQAIMALDLIGPKDVYKLLSDDEDASQMADEEFYDILLMIMALKNAITSYAHYRKMEVAAFAKEEEAKKS